MASLVFPQLSSGALVQYPVRKARLLRSIKNVLPDGNLILYPDPLAAKIVWQLSFSDLSTADITALQDHFNACNGPYHAFTFIDPVDNMLSSSANLGGAPWQVAGSIALSIGAADPLGGTSAFTAINTAQTSQEISQAVAVPSGYQYCFSVFALASQSTSLSLVRRGSSSEQSTSLGIGPSWERLISSGALEDTGSTFSVAIRLDPGQSVTLFGPQLEPQIQPARYRPTAQAGGVYSNAHWGVDELTIGADAPGLFATAFSIEAAI